MTTETLPPIISAATIAACTGPKIANERVRQIISDDSEDPEKRRLAQECIDARQALIGYEAEETRKRPFIANLSERDDGADVVDPHAEVRR